MHSDDHDRPGGLSPSDRARDWELIADYVSGQAGPDEAAAVERRARTDPSFRADLEAAALAWERAPSALAPPVTPGETVRAWSRLAAEVEGSKVVALDRHRSRGGGRGRWRGWRAAALAASITAVVGLGLMYATDRPGVPAEVAVHELVADRGQRVAVTLSDGGRVVLAPGSVLRVPESFEGDVRRVTLAGRAYFEVAPDPDRPFVVETGEVDVRVLGTTFDLRAYPGATSTEVLVRSGRVAIRPTRAPTPRDMVLERGDRGLVDRSGHVEVEHGADVDALLSWTTGRLTFERTALADVAADLERWYDVTVVVADTALDARRLTAAFDREPLDVILETIAALVNADVERDQRHVVFTHAAPQR